MLSIFYRENGKILLSQSEKDFPKFKLEDVVWIDLVQPTGDEKRSVEAFLGTEIQSRAQAEEIESSSRYFETDDAIFANTNFLTPGQDEYMMQPVSFTIVDDTLTTLREVPLRSFTELQRRLQVNPKQYPSGFGVFASILDQRVDLDADMIELLSKEISQYAKQINDQEDIDQELLIDISQMQENTMVVRENVVDKQRLISNLMRSTKVPRNLENRLNVLLGDISSLLRASGIPPGHRGGSHQPGAEQDHEDPGRGERVPDAAHPHRRFLRHERAPAHHFGRRPQRQLLELGHHPGSDGAQLPAGFCAVQKEETAVVFSPICAKNALSAPVQVRPFPNRGKKRKKCPC